MIADTLIVIGVVAVSMIILLVMACFPACYLRFFKPKQQPPQELELFDVSTVPSVDFYAGSIYSSFVRSPLLLTPPPARLPGPLASMHRVW